MDQEQALSERTRRSTRWLFTLERQGDGRRLERRNTSIGGLSFAVEVDGEHVPMRISEHALKTVFGARGGQAGWLEIYRRNAAHIDACAVALHRENPGRSVCLESADFEAVPA